MWGWGGHTANLQTSFSSKLSVRPDSLLFPFNSHRFPSRALECPFLRQPTSNIWRDLPHGAVGEATVQMLFKMWRDLFLIWFIWFHSHLMKSRSDHDRDIEREKIMTKQSYMSRRPSAAGSNETFFWDLKVRYFCLPKFILFRSDDECYILGVFESSSMLSFFVWFLLVKQTISMLDILIRCKGFVPKYIH